MISAAGHKAAWFDGAFGQLQLKLIGPSHCCDATLGAIPRKFYVTIESGQHLRSEVTWHTEHAKVWPEQNKSHHWHRFHNEIFMTRKCVLTS